MIRHDFLARLHAALQPRSYLEIGVQFGLSLRLAGCPAIGVDPAPLVNVPLPHTARVVTSTSDEFFADHHPAVGEPRVDMTFIDGMHLIEYVVRDIGNAERVSHPGSVIVLDDVLPRSYAEGSRTPNPGDWAGDVWKIVDVLNAYRSDLRFELVDVEPTGLLVVTNLDPENTALNRHYPDIVSRWATEQTPPSHVLTRRYVSAPEDALTSLEGHSW